MRPACLGILIGLLLEQWTLEGEHVETLEKDAPWMTKPDASPNGPASPTPRFSSIQMDDEGLLWLGFSVAGNDWRSAVTGTPGDWEVVDGLGYRDNIVEVVDLETGSVLASRRFTDVDLSTLFGGTHAATVGVDLATGSVRIHVLRLSVER